MRVLGLVVVSWADGGALLLLLPWMFKVVVIDLGYVCEGWLSFVLFLKLARRGAFRYVFFPFAGVYIPISYRF